MGGRLDFGDGFGAVDQLDGVSGQKGVYQVGRFGAEFGSGDILHAHLRVYLNVQFVKGMIGG